MAWKRHLRKCGRVVRLVQQNGLIQLLRLFCINAVAPILARLAPSLTRLDWRIRTRFQNLWAGRELRRLERRKNQFIEQGLRGYRLPATQWPWFSRLNFGSIQAGSSEGLVVLGSFDQDGYLYSPAGPVGSIPWISKERFLPRKKYLLDLVILNGLVAVRKNFRGRKAPFAREIKALDRLARAGCNVPAILGIDFDNLSLFVSFVPGKVLRAELVKRGAKLEDRDVEDSSALSKREAALERLRRIEEGRRLLREVIDSDFVEDCFQQICLAHQAGVTRLDIKYGNVIIEETSKRPFFIDFENVVIFDKQESPILQHYRDRNIASFDLHFGTRHLDSERTPEPRRMACARVHARWSAHHRQERRKGRP